MKFVIRFVANTIALFLALYLVDTLARGGFKVTAVAAAIILALLLGVINSLVRPLHRARTKPLVALVRTALIVAANFLILQVFAWAGAGLHATSVAWTFAAALFLGLVTGVINWLIGFKSDEKRQPSSRRRSEIRPGERQSAGAPRGRS